MSGALSPSLLPATDGLVSVLLVLLVILAVLVLAAIVAALVVLLRRRSPDETISSAGATVESTAPPPPVPPPSGNAEPAPYPARDPRALVSWPPPEPPEPPDPPATAPLNATPAPLSPTQTPTDVDLRTPEELAAAARAAEGAPAEEAQAEDAQAHQAGAVQGAGDLDMAIQHPVAIGPPRPAPAPVPHPTHPDPARLRMLGLTLGMLTERLRREHPPQLGTALARLVDSDQEAARSQLSTLALSLLGEDEEASAGEGQLNLFLEEALEGEVRRGFSFSSMPEFQQALSGIAPELREKLQTIVWARNADSVAILTTEDVEALERVAVAMATAFMLETSYDVRRLGGKAPSGGA